MTTDAAAQFASLRNVLGNSKSPYLLQHKDNPVAEFTPATIELAKRAQKPIFLSSGYSACHWCHVLAHESFENDDIATIMNEYFVNIKIDREERPDVDRMYMTYLQATSGGGGWPMSIFMTPELQPFFAGTYFPRAKFESLLLKIAKLWEDDREKCIAMGEGAIKSLQEMNDNTSRTPSSLTNILSTNPAKKVYTHLAKTYDPRYGGFSPRGIHSSGPKFPSCSMTLEPLARIAAFPMRESGSDTADRALEMGVKMLRAIWEGGIRDWVGGGVARYSVDEKWIVPHFEKMLYDQAQLASCALDFAIILDSAITEADPQHQAALQEERELCLNLAADILEYSLCDLLSSEGAFYSAEDADSAPSEGSKKSEGYFYIWSKDEFDEVVGEDCEMVGYFFGVQVDGNVERKHDMHGEMTGKNILSQVRNANETSAKFGLPVDQVLAKIHSACQRMKERRDRTRPRPGLDDKILTSWNGLMLTALAKASTALNHDTHPVGSRCADTAQKVVDFVKKEMWDSNSRTLYRSFRQGRGPIGQTDDYAFLIRGLLDLYEATGNEENALFAIELQKRQDELFWDEKGGGYFASAPDEHVLIRMKDAQDAAEPSATSVSVHNNSRLSLLVADQYEQYEKRAENTYLSIGTELEQIPRAFGYSVAGLMDLEMGYKEFIVSGAARHPRTQALLKVIQERYIPNKVIIRLDPSNLPARLAEVNGVIKSLLNNVVSEKEPSLRVCEDGVCKMPVTDLEDARKLVSEF